MAPATVSNNNSSNSTSSRRGNDQQEPAMAGKVAVQKYLTKCKSFYSCIYCRTHLANHDELVSRSFQGNHGRAYLFNSVINISCGPAVQRELNTGSHAVADILCSNCETTLGWKYEKAYVETQKYKEGKYIIELAHVVRENRHLELDRSEIILAANKQQQQHQQQQILNRSNDNDIKRQQYRQSQQENLLSPSSPTPNYLSSQSKYYGSSNSGAVAAAGFADDADELMFPFYDDLCIDRSSNTSILSSSRRSKIRRSMYLDSTPYDWKYSSTTSATGLSNQQHNLGKPINSSSSIGGSSNVSPSDSSSPTSSSSSSGGFSPSHKEYVRSTNNGIGARSTSDDEQENEDYYNPSNSAEKFRNEPTNRHYEPGTSDENETQFSFEADAVGPEAHRESLTATGAIKDESVTSTAACNQNQNSHDNSINYMNFDDENIDNIVDDDDDYNDLSNQSDQTNRDNRLCHNITNSSETRELYREQPELEQQAESSASATATTTTNNINSTATCSKDVHSIQSNSISLDDDEFFDCCTDHDISNLIIVTDSN